MISGTPAPSARSSTRRALKRSRRRTTRPSTFTPSTAPLAHTFRNPSASRVTLTKFCFTTPIDVVTKLWENIYGRILAVSCWLTLCDNGNRKTDCGSTPLHGHSLLVGGGHDDTRDGRRHLHGQHRWVIGALFVVATFMSLQIIIFGFTFVTCKVQKLNRRTGTTVVNFLALVRRGFDERFSASCYWSTLTNCLCCSVHQPYKLWSKNLCERA